MIANNFPKHLLASAKSGFLAGTKATNLAWQRVASVYKMNAAAVDLVDLGAAPMPTESVGQNVVKEFIEKTMEIKPTSWDLNLALSYNAVADDQTGSLLTKARGAGANFQRHINNRVFKVLNAGDASTYGLCYDGEEFFDSDHADDGAHYSTDQDNEYDLALSNDNFNTVAIAAAKVKDDQGEYSGFMHNLLVIPPDLRKEANDICFNPEEAGTGNRDANPYDGIVKYLVSPEMDSTAWVLIAESEIVKPMIVAMRQQPFLQSAWFDPDEGNEGGYYHFKWYARYKVYYGDWRLAFLGNS